MLLAFWSAVLLVWQDCWAGYRCYCWVVDDTHTHTQTRTRAGGWTRTRAQADELGRASTVEPPRLEIQTHLVGICQWSCLYMRFDVVPFMGRLGRVCACGCVVYYVHYVHKYMGAVVVGGLGRLYVWLLLCSLCQCSASWAGMMMVRPVSCAAQRG